MSSTSCQGIFEGVANYTAKVDKVSQTVPIGIKITLGNIPIITVTAQDDMNFGDILSSSSSTVSVGTNGNRTCSPSSNCIGNQSNQGVFLVQSSSATPLAITVDCPIGAVQMVGGGNNFYIDSFVCSLSNNTVSSSSPATVNVGATLHVPQGQASGQYNATYTITVNN